MIPFVVNVKEEIVKHQTYKETFVFVEISENDKIVWKKKISKSSASDLSCIGKAVNEYVLSRGNYCFQED